MSDTAPQPTPNFDFSTMDGTPSRPIGPADGTFLAELTEFAPVINEESGVVERWTLRFKTAETIQDNQQPPEPISEGSVLPPFSVFTTSQFDIRPIVAMVKRYSEALNDIPRTDPRAADEAWKALPAMKKLPCFVGDGSRDVLVADKQYYDQWLGTVVLITIRRRKGREQPDLADMQAKSTKRVK